MIKKISVFIVIMLLVGCKKDHHNEAFVTSILHTIEVSFDEYLENKPAEGVSVKLTSLQDGVHYEVMTNAEGKAQIQLPSGTYDVNASLTLSPAQMKTLSGQEQEVAFNASLSRIRITTDTNEPTQLRLTTGKIGNILIKQVYYAGSDNKLGAADRDQFIELHNNSNQTIYLDNLCIALVYGVTKVFTGVDFILPNNQYDWSKSPDLADMGNRANTDYIYSRFVLSFPGTGTDYPLASGKSVLIARTAQNHKAPLTIAGKTYSIANPDLTIDLSKAPFEVYTEDTSGLTKDIDNPTAVDMKMEYNTTSFKELMLNFVGREAYAIFYKPSDFDQFRKVRSPEKDRRGNINNRLHLQIPNNIVIDGVNLYPLDGNMLPNRLPQSIDAGNIKLTKGQYSSQSAIRKISKRVADKIYYQDTNNSEVDFQSIDRPNTESLH